MIRSRRTVESVIRLENVEGDLDGDGDLSNSNLNDEDIMGDEAHSAPAGGDF